MHHFDKNDYRAARDCSYRLRDSLVLGPHGCTSLIIPLCHEGRAAQMWAANPAKNKCNLIMYLLIKLVNEHLYSH